MAELLPHEPGIPDWHAARRAGVTATDIVTILGLSRWDSVYSLFWRKLGQVPEVGDSDRFRLGRELEPYIVRRWQEENERALLPGLHTSAGLWRHSERAWQMATLDRMVSTGTGYRPVELKSWADADRRSWDDGPPAQVRAQVLWQMDIRDATHGHVGVVFLPSGEFRSYTIEHDGSADCAQLEHVTDDGVCSVCKDLELMRAAGEEFMARLRLELPPPDPDASMATLAAVRARFTRQPDKEAEVNRNLYLDWTAYDLAVKGAEQQKRRVEILMREQVGEASVLTVDGQPVARRIIVDADVKAHHRHQDYLKRIEPKGDENATD
jgi:putative phage-type endonuclease